MSPSGALVAELGSRCVPTIQHRRPSHRWRTRGLGSSAAWAGGWDGMQSQTLGWPHPPGPQDLGLQNPEGSDLGGGREKREERAACPQGRAGVQTRGRMDMRWGWACAPVGREWCSKSKLSFISVVLLGKRCGQWGADPREPAKGRDGQSRAQSWAAASGRGQWEDRAGGQRSRALRAGGMGPDGSVLLRVSAPQCPQALQLVAMATAGPGLCVRPLLPTGGPLAKPWPLTS